MLVLKMELIYVLKPCGGEGGREGLQHAHLFQKKFSPRTLCPQRAHALCSHTGYTSCAATRRVPFMGFSSLGSQNMGEWSGGAEEGNAMGAKSACPMDDQCSPRRHQTNRLLFGLYSLWCRGVHLDAFALFPASRLTSMAVSDN